MGWGGLGDLDLAGAALELGLICMLVPILAGVLLATALVVVRRRDRERRRKQSNGPSGGESEQAARYEKRGDSE